MEMRVSGWWWFGSCTGLWSWMGSFSVYAQLLRTIMQLKGLNVLLLSFINCISVSQCRLSPLESTIELQTNVNTNDPSESQLLHCHSDLIDTLAVFDHMFSLKSYNMHLYMATSWWQKAIVSMDVHWMSQFPLLIFNSLPMELLNTVI